LLGSLVSLGDEELSATQRYFRRNAAGLATRLYVEAAGTISLPWLPMQVADGVYLRLLNRIRELEFMQPIK
jgi:hypothetical protein